MLQNQKECPSYRVRLIHHCERRAQGYEIIHLNQPSQLIEKIWCVSQAECFSKFNYHSDFRVSLN